MKDSVTFEAVMPSGKVWKMVGYKGNTSPVDKAAELVLSSTFHPISKVEVSYESDKPTPHADVHTYNVVSVLEHDVDHDLEDWKELCWASKNGTLA